MRCTFCHNMDLVLTDASSEYSKQDILDFLNKRKGILDGVCITGGEPTLYSDLPDFIRNIRDIGMKIKLDTNGTNPLMLEQLISDSVVDYIAMDIKTSPDNYAEICGVSNIDMSSILKSIDILKQSDIEYEFRTTLIAEYHNLSVMSDIGLLLDGASNYYLQGFVDSAYVPNHNLSAPDKDTMLSYVDLLSRHIRHVELRGI